MSKNTGTSELINYFTLGASGAVDIGGNLTLSTIANATTDTDKFLVSDTGIIKYRTGAELLTDIGAAPATGGSYLPLAGGTLTGALNGTSATWSNINVFTGASIGAGSQRWIGSDGSAGLFLNTPTGSGINLAINNNPILGIASTGAATFSGSVTAGSQLSILGTDGGGKILYFTGGTTKYNFMIAAQQNVNNALEITPSTAAGGSTFSTPALTIASTGAATFSSSVTATQLNATTTAAGYASILTNTNGASDSNGLLVKAGSVSSEYVVRFAPQSDASTFFTVKGNGNVGIGTASPGTARLVVHYDGANPNLILSATGTSSFGVQRFTNDNGIAGSISMYATSVGYNTSSDYRLKQDLKEYNGLSLVSAIKTYDYEWKVDNKRAYGVLAHELQEVLPQAVFGEKDAEEMQGVDYSKLVPIMIKAIQEQQAQIQELKNKLS